MLNHREWKKCSEATQTLSAGCSKVEPKMFALPQTLPGGAGRPKFNQLEMVTTFTYRPGLVKIDARNFEWLWPTNKHTNRQGRLQYTALQLSMQCKYDAARDAEGGEWNQNPKTYKALVKSPLPMSQHSYFKGRMSLLSPNQQCSCVDAFNGHFPVGPRLAGTRMTPLGILLELRVMEVVETTGAVRHAQLQSNHHHQQTNIQLFTGRMPFLSPNQQCQSTEGNETETETLHIKLQSNHHYWRNNTQRRTQAGPRGLAPTPGPQLTTL